MIEIKPGMLISKYYLSLDNEKVVEQEWNTISAKMRRFSKWFHIMAFFFINASVVAGTFLLRAYS